MLQLKLQSFGHDAKNWLTGKTLMLGKIEGRRRRGWQRMGWLDGIIGSMDMSLSKLWKLVMDRRPGVLQSMGSQRVRHDWVTELNWTEYPFVIKTLLKVGVEGTYLNVIKPVYDKPTAKLYSTEWKAEIFSSKIRNKTRPTLSISIWHSRGSPSHSNWTRKRNKLVQIGREEVKLSLFADDMILCRENPEISTKKLLEPNLAKQLDTRLTYRNLLLPYTIIMNYQKEKTKKPFHLQ